MSTIITTNDKVPTLKKKVIQKRQQLTTWALIELLINTVTVYYKRPLRLL